MVRQRAKRFIFSLCRSTAKSRPVRPPASMTPGPGGCAKRRDLEDAPPFERLRPRRLVEIELTWRNRLVDGIEPSLLVSAVDRVSY
jgi:hypothetical protein